MTEAIMNPNGLRIKGVVMYIDDLPKESDNGDVYVVRTETYDDTNKTTTVHEDQYVAVNSDEGLKWNILRNNIYSIPDEDVINDELTEKYKDRDDYDGQDLISETAETVINSNGDEEINIVEDIMEKGTQDFNYTPTIDSLSEELRDVYNMPEEEIFQMMMIIQRLNKGENFSVYNALPDKMKNLVMAGMASNNIPPTMENRNITARALLTDILNDVKTDEDFADFNEALKEITQIPALIDFQSENCKELMEEKLVEFANNCREEKPEVADSLIKISDAWKDTYTFNRLYKRFNEKESYRNSVTKDIDKWYPKRVRDFNFKAEKSHYKINDIHIMLRALKKFFGNKYPERIYKGFICQFYYTTMDLDFNKPEDAAYVYYTIKNVISLEFVNKEKILDFNQELVTNLEKMFDYIVELDKLYQDRLTKTKKGRKK